VYSGGVTENLGGIVIISEPISTQRVLEMAVDRFGDMVKAVVDTNQRRLALGGELQSDEEAAPLALGSTQTDLWGLTSIRRRRGQNGSSLTP
jgi:Protein of unknown function (DUF5674)